MPLRAEKAAPLQGVKGVKPCLRQPKISRRPETPETVRLNEEYLTKRNKILDLKYKREAMNLALDRDRSIDKRLVERHLSYLAIAMRQKLFRSAPNQTGWRSWRKGKAEFNGFRLQPADHILLALLPDSIH
jgi:hypothetical protein